MHWRAKVAGFKLLSVLPGGSALYRFCQEHLTKSLVPSPERVAQKLAVGLQYFDWLNKHQRQDLLLHGVHLDLGAGWHPTIPFLFYSLGADRQFLFDLVPLLDARLIQRTLETFLRIVREPGWPHRGMLRRLPPPLDNGDWRHYFQKLGIDYHAPYTSIFSSFAARVDLITCTQVLYYIPRAALPGCIRQVHGSLKPGGVFLATINLRDVFGNSQPGPAKYNHLRYSTEAWERSINSPLMSYNRFKAPDYRELLEEAGFEILHFEVEAGTAEDLKELESIPVAPCFERYSRADLAARHLFFVARKT
jgi:hypothetical protein